MASNRFRKAQPLLTRGLAANCALLSLGSALKGKKGSCTLHGRCTISSALPPYLLLWPQKASSLKFCKSAGRDQSLCILLALLLYCFREPEPGRWSTFEVPYTLGNSDSDKARNESLLDGNVGNCYSSWRQTELPPDEFRRSHTLTGRNKMHWEAHKQADNPSASKAAVRRCLSFVSSFYPLACPSRGSLRQVSGFLRLAVTAR